MRFVLPIKTAQDIHEILDAGDLIEGLVKGGSEKFAKNLEAQLAKDHGKRDLVHALYVTLRLMDALGKSPCSVEISVTEE